MRKIEQAMIDAIVNHKNFTRSNTRVEIYTRNDEPACLSIYLNNNCICRYRFNEPTFTLCDSGYADTATRSRLNALAVHFTGSASFITHHGVIVAINHPPSYQCMGRKEWALTICQNTKETA